MSDDAMQRFSAKLNAPPVTTDPSSEQMIAKAKETLFPLLEAVSNMQSIALQKDERNAVGITDWQANIAERIVSASINVQRGGGAVRPIHVAVQGDLVITFDDEMRSRIKAQTGHWNTDVPTFTDLVSDYIADILTGAA